MRIICLKLTLFFLLLNSLAYSQQSTFRININIANMDIPGGIIQTASGHYVLAGTNATLLPYGNITRVDLNGNLVWSKGIQHTITTEITDVIEVSTGGFLVTGSSNSGAILVRLTDNGTLIWSQKYELPNGGGKTSYEYASAVKETSDGGFIVGGSVDYFWDGSSPTTADSTMPFAFKVNSTGVLQWSRVYVIAVSNPDEHYFTDISETADGYFFVGNTSEGTGTLNDDGDYPRDGLIVKTDKNGNLVYARKFGSSGSSEYVNSMITLSTGNVLIGGSRGDNGFLMRINGTGGTPTIGFGHRYARQILFINQPLEFYSVVEMPDGHYGALAFNLVLPFSFYSSSIKFNNSTGNQIFAKNYPASGMSSIIPIGGVANDTGFYCIMTAQQTSFNYHLLKTDINGNLNNSACPEESVTLSRNGYTPTLTAITPTVYSNMATSSSFTPTINNLTPIVSADCKNIVCVKPPMPTVAATPTEVCPGQSSILSSSGSGTGITYHYFTDSTAASFATGTSTTVTPSVTTTYYVAAEDNNNPGCFSYFRPITVTVKPLPTITFSSNSPVCVGTTLTITATGGGSYQWSGPGSFTHNTANVNIPNAQMANGGTYNVTVTGTNSCVNTGNTSITMVPQPTASASGTSPICQGGTSNLTATGLSGSTFSWSHGAGNTANVTVSPTVTTTYTVSVMDANNCGTATANVIVNVVPSPVVNTNPDTICKGSTYSPTPNVSFYSSVLWSTSGSGSFNDATLLNPVYTPSQSDNNTGQVTLTITVTGNSPCGSTSGNIQLALIQPAAPSLTNVGTPVCANANPFALTGTPSGGTFTGNGVSANQFNPSIAGVGNHGITYTVSDNYGCTNQSTDTITVWPLPIADAGANQSICEGDSIIITATGLHGSTFLWSHNAGDSASVTVSPLITTTYTVTVTDENNCGIATDNVTITVVPLPVITVNDDSICAGQTYQTSITAINHSSVSWSSSGTGSFNSTSILNPVYTPDNNDISNGEVVLTVTANGNNPCGNVSEDFTLTILPLPHIQFDNLAGVCLNSSTITLNTATPSGGSYTGTGVANGIFNPQNAGAGQHLLTYSYTDIYGCSNSETASIQVYQLPIVSLSAFNNVCITETSVNITGGTPTGGYYYGDNIQNNEFTPPTAGTGLHQIHYVYEDANGCSDTASSTILVVPEITLESDVPENTIYVDLGALVNFTASPDNQGTYVFGIDSTDLQNSTSHLFAANTLTEGNVVYVVLNEACSDSLTIFVKPVPNAFVPFNNDGSNDIFMPYVDLTIVNRWGQELYKGTEGWDGKYKGQNVSPGTYFYIIRIAGLNGDEKLMTGTVTLVTKN